METQVFFPTEPVVINCVDLLHSTNFPELIPLWTTAALLEKHPILIMKLAVKQKSASCTRGQLPLKPLLLSTAALLGSVFHPLLSFPSVRIKGTLASLCSLYKQLQMVTEFSLPGLWSSRLSQLNGYETGPELFHGSMRLLQFLASFSSSEHSYTQCQILGQQHLPESHVNIHHYLLCNFWPHHHIRLSPAPQIIQPVPQVLV